jgi:hypothetical protein
MQGTEATAKAIHQGEFQDLMSELNKIPQGMAQ